MASKEGEDGKEKGSFQILYFASASTYTSLDSERLPAPLPLSELHKELEKRYPGITKAVLGSCAVTLNLEYVDIPPPPPPSSSSIEGERESGASASLMIKDGDEVAIVPPVSSG